MTKEQFINDLIQEKGYRSYLEIGYGSGDCFGQIQCEYKHAVDPDIQDGHEYLHKCNSDEFFASAKDQEFDVIFIDGLHHADQVRKDINNASKHLSADGVILLHDIHPETEEMQIVPRQQKEWTGDVWRAWDGFKKKYPDAQTQEVPVRYGLGLIFPNGKKFKAHFEDMETTWQERLHSIQS
ncbi:class I SAM-dependent methyltransferase [Sphingobacterium sp. SGG-5]|uniref:class I SAM-dependent methyltransferase n=1 Tax=Sphingobacterium sp. SGG-5 TaxID=2710881 RepID=UPI0013EC3627|nr:class I SAM-dependent methyltransferase [Sphingobacterium sp. SGG-5]NGM63496.1 class I SAM-dependent methyltransferase [Sphingobacterium sp. SGG-5]